MEPTCNSNLLGSILSNIDNTYTFSKKGSQPNMPKANPQNTTPKYYKHKDPLGLETNQFPTEYKNIVEKLIREDYPIQEITFNATSGEYEF